VSFVKGFDFIEKGDDNFEVYNFIIWFSCRHVVHIVGTVNNSWEHKNG